MSIDVLLDSDLDLQFADNGDILTTDTEETAILCALFYEQRFNNKRGHFGFEDGEGSKLWTLDQSRLTQNTINNSVLYSNSALNFLNLDKKVSANIKNNGIMLNIETITNNEISAKEYSL